MRKKTLGFLIAALALVAVPASATILVYHSVEDLAAIAEEVVLGTVRQMETRSGAEGKSVYTLVTVEVTESFTGATRQGDRLTVQYYGGERDGVSVRYLGMPTFQVGEEAVLFLKWREGVVFSLVGLTQGKMEVHRVDQGARAVRRLAGIPVLQIGQDAGRPEMGSNESYTLDELRARVQRRSQDRGRERTRAR